MKEQSDVKHRPEQVDAAPEERKRELFSYLLENELAEPADAQRIPRCDNAVSEVLSFGQESLWFLHQLDPCSAAYNLYRVQRLHGTLNTRVLERSFEEILRRHQVLRTAYPAVDGKASPAIALQKAFVICTLDLQELPKRERQRESQELIDREVGRPFDLATDVLIRVTLLRLERREHILLLITHHMVADAWSMGILFQELSSLYTALSEDSGSLLADLPIQYSDFAAAQHQWFEGGASGPALAYWKSQLEGMPPVLGLPTDRSRPAVQAYSGSEEPLLLSKTLTEGLKSLSRKEGVTLFATLLAAYWVLLARYSGQRDVPVGVPVANRTSPNTAKLIGFFVNTLVFRGNFSTDSSFGALLAQVNRTWLAAYDHQSFPFEKLVDVLHVPRELSRNPLFQVMFVFNSIPQPSLKLPGLLCSPIRVKSQTAKVDLTLTLTEGEAGITGAFEYNDELFQSTTISRMAQNFLTLLSGVVAHPETRLSQLPLLSREERARLLTVWNDPSSSFVNPLRIDELVEAQVGKTPDATAAVFQGELLTYRELSSRSDKLASYLRSQGVAPETRVGVAMRPSLSLLVALMGILKSGAAYVPLDPSYPVERLNFMLQDSDAVIVLTDEPTLASERSMGARAAAYCCRTVCLDSEWKTIEQQTNLGDPEAEATGDNLAYVIYTSGSSGTPKGVSIQHRSTSALVNWARATFSSSDLVAVLASTSICFDLSVFEIFVPLSSGGRVIVAENVFRVADLLAAENVTLINTVPSVVKELLNSALPRSVQTVNLAGEPLQTGLVNEIYEKSRVEHVYDLYGPTEATTYSTYALRDRNRRATIGRPINHTKAYLLDRAGEPVPVGVTGEICIGGAGLARGYLKRSDLTAERFIPDPFSSVPGMRLYRTGDLGRYLEGGELEYRGRMDRQVKVRGNRIELGEVEVVLGGHRGVAEAAVVAQPEIGAGDGKRLVAYVVLDGGAAAGATELRGFLQEKLPEYMVPSAFVYLDAMPLTPNGKVDRRALPMPDDGRRVLRQVFVAPRTRLEELVAGIWVEVLNVDRVGIHDNFFELGGHSLLAIRVLSRLRSNCRAELPLRVLFEAPTVSDLAARVEGARQAEQGLSAPPMRRVARDGDLPLSFAQQRLWFLEQLAPGGAVYNIPVVVRLTGALNVEALVRSFEEIVRRHEVLRTQFRVSGGEPVQVVAHEGAVEIPVVDLEGMSVAARGREVERVAASEVRKPFDLVEGLPMRATLLRVNGSDHVLVLTTHHMVSDGWSMGIICRELSALYECFAAGKRSVLSELPVQYVDFAVWQREWLLGEVLEKELSYWKGQLRDAPHMLELPTDYPRPRVERFRGARASLALPADLTEGLRRLSEHAGATLFMTLLAGFKALLYRYTGQQDIVVGSPMAGRGWPELEGVIGFFVHTLALRTAVSGEVRFLELLARVRETCLGAYTHQDIPFERLVEELQLERDLSRNPLFQVMFVFQPAPILTLELPHVRASRVGVDTGTAKFDLTLTLVDAEGGLTGSVEYNTDLFRGATIGRMIGHWRRLLEGIIADPGQRLAEVQLLTDEERQQLLVEWNATGCDYPDGWCIHELFEAQVERTPEAVAVVFEEEWLTYAELNARANQLAHYLLALGIGPEGRVGVCMARSAEMLVGLLGILKAGGTYVPLDPSYPQERLVLMMEDSGVAMVLTDERNNQTFASYSIAVVCLDHEWQQVREYPIGSVSVEVMPEQAAYVIYTSGSLGVPKGVVGLHRSTVNRLSWMWGAYPFEADEICCQKTSLSFVDSVWELFGPLLRGVATVIIADELVREGLVEALSEREISRIVLVPSLLRLILDSEAELARELSRVRYWVSSGEPLSEELAARFRERMPGATLLNLYGSSEVAGDVTACEAERNESISLGRPIGNTQVYVVASHIGAVPVGVTGEICVGGAGLARGYLKRSDLTAERFIPDPFGSVPGMRLYRTGDLGRYLEGGELEYRGRMDRQVKVRGNRIELGEVEVVLGGHRGVAEAAVVAQPEIGAGDGKRLVAYVVLDGGAAAGATELRGFLQEKLPEYMVPSAFVYLDTMPLTPNGKVDRRALPMPKQDRWSLDRVQETATCDPLKSRMISLWENILRRAPIRVTDNFFEVGGNSLLAVRLFAEIEKRFSKALPIASLFQSPTIEGLVCLLEDKRSSLPASSLVAIQPQGKRPPFFLVHAEGGQVVPFHKLAYHLAPEQPVYGLQAQGLDGRREPYTTIEDMAVHYISEIRAAQPEGPYLLGGHCFGATIAFEMARQLNAAGEKPACLILLDPLTPFGLFKRSLRYRLRRVHYLITRRPKLLLWHAREYVQQKRLVRRRLGRLQGLSGILNSMARVRRANLLAGRAYAAKPYNGRIACLWSDELAQVKEFQAIWEQLSENKIDSWVIPAAQFELLEEPYVRLVAKQLKACLDGARSSI